MTFRVDEDYPLRVKPTGQEEPTEELHEGRESSSASPANRSIGGMKRSLKWTSERMDALQKAVLKYGTRWVTVARELGMEDKIACRRTCKKKFEYEVAAGRMHKPP
jgi:hypothetical protein